MPWRGPDGSLPVMCRNRCPSDNSAMTLGGAAGSSRIAPEHAGSVRAQPGGNIGANRGAPVARSWSQCQNALRSWAASLHARSGSHSGCAADVTSLVRCCRRPGPLWSARGPSHASASVLGSLPIFFAGSRCSAWARARTGPALKDRSSVMSRHLSVVSSSRAVAARRRGDFAGRLLRFQSGLFLHAADEAVGPHVGPIAIDELQAGGPAVGLMDDRPAVGNVDEGRPERVLSLVVHQARGKRHSRLRTDWSHRSPRTPGSLCAVGRRSNSTCATGYVSIVHRDAAMIVHAELIFTMIGSTISAAAFNQIFLLIAKFRK